MSSLLDTRVASLKAFEKAWHAKDAVEFEAKKFAEKGKADKAALLEPKIKQVCDSVGGAVASNALNLI